MSKTPDADPSSDTRPPRTEAAHVPIEALDLSLAALFVGYALADETAERIRSAGHPDLRFNHGFLFQHIVAGPASISDIAEAQGVTTQAVSQQLGELEALGYVERSRDPTDRRVRLVTLTERGSAAVETAQRARSAIQEEVAAAVGADRLATAVAVLHDVLRTMGSASEVTGRRVRRPR